MGHYGNHDYFFSHPTSQWLANRYSASLFVANITQIGRAPRMPNSHNQLAHRPIRWNCVQLKRHKKGDQRMAETGYSLPPLTQTTKRGLNQEWSGNFPSFPPDDTRSKMRSQLGVLLEVFQYKLWLSRQNEELTRNATKNLLVPMDYWR